MMIVVGSSVVARWAPARSGCCRCRSSPHAAGHRGPVVTAGTSPYGPIRPQKDETTGLELLKLPDGFRYWSYSWTGDVMSDGVRCPNLHDGMAVVDDWQPADRRRGRVKGDDRDDDEGRRRSGKVVLVRNHEGGAGANYVTGRPDITYAPTGGATGSGGTTNLVFDTRRAKWESSWSSLAGTIRNCAGGVTPWGSLADLRGDGRRRARLGLRRRLPQGQHHAARRDGPLLARGADGRPAFRRGLRDRGRRQLRVLQVRALSRRRASIRAGASTCWRSRTSPNADLGAFWPIGTTWDVKWVRIDDPLAVTAVLLRAGRRQGRRALQPSRRRVVGPPHRLLPLDQRRQRRRRPGVRVRPARRDAEGDLRRAERRERGQPGQHDRHAARRPAAVRGRGRQRLHRRRAPRRPDAARPGVHVRDEQHQPDQRLQRRRSGRATTGRTSGPARATAPTAAGCSPTSRRRASRSRSPVRGARARSERSASRRSARDAGRPLLRRRDLSGERSSRSTRRFAAAGCSPAPTSTSRRSARRPTARTGSATSSGPS